jgi:tetratricopeptide (TPR) repeat protein
LDLNDPMIQNLPSTTIEGLDGLTVKPRDGTHPIVRKPPLLGRRIQWAAAVALVVIAVGIAVLNFDKTARANTLLAQAYTDGRSLELRIPLAAHGPIRQTRGSIAADSLALREAEAIISKALRDNPSNLAWLEAEARARLLQWRFDDALEILGMPQASVGTNSSILADLAIAHFERGQVKDDLDEYRIALNFLTQAIASTQDRADLRFNRAILYEHLGLRPQAISEWNVFLGLEPTGGWAEEARGRLNQLGK